MIVESICSMTDVASIVCVLSSLLRLFVAIEPMIRPTMLNEPTTRIKLAIIVSIIVMPASERLRSLP